MHSALPKIELVNLRLLYPPTQETTGDCAPDANVAVDLSGSNSAPSIQIFPGEHTVLLGPSGCGKSSLLRLIAGLVQPTDGEVLKDGRPVAGPDRDRVLVFQSYTSFPWLTVEENVLFGLQLDGGNASQHNRLEKVHEIVRLVGLSDSLHKYPRELSGGMKQRVAIARSLVCDPDILLMDEPFGALDPHIRVKMQELMLQIERTLHTTVIFVTHDAREAVFLGDTIYISTLRPCFLKYRIEHPFKKAEIQREKARERFANDFLRFQREVENHLQYLIEHPEAPRVIEETDYSSFKRSILGMLEELSGGIGEP
jgi:ABC-type nitrate/sulfonate/bicarbonate transport system ATPase subunit